MCASGVAVHCPPSACVRSPPCAVPWDAGFGKVGGIWRENGDSGEKAGSEPGRARISRTHGSSQLLCGGPPALPGSHLHTPSLQPSGPAPSCVGGQAPAWHLGAALDHDKHPVLDAAQASPVCRNSCRIWFMKHEVWGIMWGPMANADGAPASYVIPRPLRYKRLSHMARRSWYRAGFEKSRTGMLTPHETKIRSR